MKKSVLSFCLLYVLSCSVTSIISFWVYQTVFKDELKKIKIYEKVLVQNQIDLIEKTFSEIQSDLMFLSNQYRLKLFLSTGDSKDKQNLLDDYCVYANSKKRYDQIRLLCIKGQELIRVNYINGYAVKVPDDHLQDKCNRYYFHEIVKSDEIYTSRMDLNVENNKIEKPFKPVMRFGITVNNLEGERKGIILLNFLGNSIFQIFKKDRNHANGHISILNTQGYWLDGPNKEALWGFMLKKRAHITFENKFPLLWTRIRDNSSGQIYHQGDIFTWETLKFGNQEEWFWKILSHVPKKDIKISNANFKEAIIFLNIVIMFFLVIPTALVVRLLHKRRQHLKDLFKSANYDKLTGLANRAMFYTRLEKIISYAERYNEQFAILFIDIDGFKIVNDTLGHDVGDKLLQQIASRLKEITRDSDLVSRLGGDEFILLIRNITTPTDATGIAKKVVKYISTEFEIPPHFVNVGASIGISVYPENGKTSDLLIQKADKAMYKCKKSGKNNFCLSDS